MNHPFEKHPFESAAAPAAETKTPHKPTLADELRVPFTNAPKSVIIQASHELQATPAVHEVESRQAVVNPGGGNVIHAAYSPKDDRHNKIIQVNSAVSNEPAARVDLDALASGAAAPAVPSAPAAMPHAASASGHPSVSVEWTPRGEILVGEECAFDLTVTNHGDVAVNNIEVDAFFPQTVRLTAARPKPASAEEHVTWKVDSLEPGEKEVLSVKLIPSRRGDLDLSSKVRFTGETAGKFVVTEPIVEVAVEGPSEVLIGQPVTHVIKIANTGTGTAREVSLEALIPEGLQHPRGERLLLEVGSLEAGQVREVRLALAAVAGGDQKIKLAAESANSVRKMEEIDLLVLAPSLALKLDGPGLRYKGRNGVFHITLENDGNATSENVRLRERLPNGFEFVKAGLDGKYDAQTGSIDWFLGDIKPGEKKEISVELTAVSFGKFTHEVAAVSERGAQSLAELETRVEGTSSLSLEIVDQDDPVEVGVEHAYEITVKNGGSIAAGNVGVAFELPEGVEFVSAEGPSDYAYEKGIVFFRSLANLAPEKAVTYQIRVKGTRAGNLRFRARLASDSIQEPLIFEEMTKYYGE